MKKIILLIIASALSTLAMAQTELLSLDEHNNYMFYKVIDKPGSNADTLYDRIYAGLSKNKRFKDIDAEKSKHTISIKAKMLVYTSNTLARHEAGEVTYTLTTEVKDAKYRYRLNDMIFYPYERTRYGTFAKKPGIAYTLQQLRSKYSQREFEVYLDQIAKFGRDVGDEMAEYISVSNKRKDITTKIDTKNW